MQLSNVGNERDVPIILAEAGEEADPEEVEGPSEASEPPAPAEADTPKGELNFPAADVSSRLARPTLGAEYGRLPYKGDCLRMLESGEIKADDFERCLLSKFGWRAIGTRLSFTEQWIGTRYNGLYDRWNATVPKDFKMSSGDAVFSTGVRQPQSAWTLEVTNGPGFSYWNDTTLFRTRSALTMFGADQPINSGRWSGALLDAEFLRQFAENDFFGIEPVIMRFDGKPQTFVGEYVGLGIEYMNQFQGYPLGKTREMKEGADILMLLSGHAFLGVKGYAALTGDHFSDKFGSLYRQIPPDKINGCQKNPDGDAFPSWSCNGTGNHTQTAGLSLDLAFEPFIFGIQRWGWGAFSYDFRARYLPRYGALYASGDINFELIRSLLFKINLGVHGGYLWNLDNNQNAGYPDYQFDARAYLGAQFTPFQ